MSYTAPLGARSLFHDTFPPALFRSRQIVLHLNYYAILLRRYSSRSSLGHFCIFFLLAQYLDLTHYDCSLLLKRDRTFPLTVFSTYTMEKIWQLAHGAQQCCCPSYRWQRNTVRGRIDFTRHPQLVRKYWCAQDHPSFYALTSLFPSISPSPLLLTASATPYFLRVSDPSANFFEDPSPS